MEFETIDDPMAENRSHNYNMITPVFIFDNDTHATNTSTPGRIEPGQQQPQQQSRDSLWFLRVWMFGAGGATVACLGIVCNVITIAVLVNFRTKSSAPFLLSCLALSDTIHLLFLLVLENLTQLAKAAVIDPAYNQSPIVQGLYSKMWSVHFVTQTLSIYIVVVITIERYVVVCWPFKAKTICSFTSARIAMVVVVVFALTINLPHYMAYQGGWAWRNATQTEQFYFRRTSFGNSYFFQEIFYKWMQMTFNFIVPLTVLLSFNTLSILGLRRNMATAFGNTNRRDVDNRLTVMVTCMTAIFFFCELMAAIGHVMVSGYNSYSEVSATVNRFVAVSDFLMMVNAAVNFAIYCVTGKKFRETFKTMFGLSNCSCHCITRDQHTRGIYSKQSTTNSVSTKKTTISSETLNNSQMIRGNPKDCSVKAAFMNSNESFLNENCDA